MEVKLHVFYTFTVEVSFILHIRKKLPRPGCGMGCKSTLDVLAKEEIFASAGN
jgi:hypothetical protein